MLAFVTNNYTFSDILNNSIYFIIEFILKTDSIVKIFLDYCIMTITYVSDEIGKTPF